MPGMDWEAFYGKENIVLMAKVVWDFKIRQKNPPQNPAGIKIKILFDSQGIKGGGMIFLYII